jgi:P-type Ca2+ transporter type 2C
MSMKYTGLTTKEAQENLKTYGLNEIIEVNKTYWYDILLRQIKSNFIVYLLIAASILSFLVGKSATAYTILAVIFLVIGVGFFQEYRAEKAVSSLKKMITSVSLVIRNSKEIEISSNQIVPGDIIILRTGERVPADGFLIEEKHISLNESILTGESKEVRKVISNKEDILEDSKVYMASFVVSGKGVLKVTHTGMNTKFGKIAKLISGSEKELPLQRKINKITKFLALIGLSLAVLTGLLVLLKSPLITREVIIDVIILIIATSVAAFPEGLPVVLVTTLSSGAHRMARKNAVVSRMSIIETLGETTVICTDKTGTITKGEMTVKNIFLDNKMFQVTGVGFEKKGEIIYNKKVVDFKEHGDLNLLLKASVFCNDSFISKIENEKNFKITGLPTEAALLVLASKADIYKEDYDVLREEEIPFSSERKIMSVLISDKGKKTIYVKGALEFILKKCNYILKNGKVLKITESDIKKIMVENNNMTKKALRTLAFAYKDKNFTDLESDLIFLGFVGMEDPPREEVKETIVLCKKAGINVKMITGDNKETAIAISKEIGILKGDVLEGFQIDELTDDELEKIISDVSVFARVRPEHKLRIVKALKKNGEIVTMTGDGVNDAPALKEAHVGVAMGITGTDVSRSVADLILKDDNFATIVEAIKEGRTIFANIRKFMTYQISCNLSQISIIFLGVLIASRFGWAIPLLLPLQILFMNIVTDNIPSIALGFNPPSNDIMNERPQKTKSIFTKNLIYLLVFSSILITFFTLLVYYITYNVLSLSYAHAATTALLTLIMLQVFGAFVFRSFRKGVFTRSLFINKHLFFASLISIVATIVIIYTPLNIAFDTIPINLIEWVVALGVGILFIFIFDVLKYINKYRKFWTI